MSEETRDAARRRLGATFRDAGIESAEIDARLLVCAAARIDHAAFICDCNLPLINDEAARLAEFAAQRLERAPISRILGRREFWGLDFILSPDVLDPRPETEGLVASVLDSVGGRRSLPLSILDLGVGTGAILCALLTELPRAVGYGIDYGESACRIARANLGRLGLSDRGAIICADWTNALDHRFDVVVSNPPYVATADVATLDRDVRDYDPRLALDGGSDGLNAYRAIAARSVDLLNPQGVAAFECGAGQGVHVSALLEDSGLAGATVYKDLAGLDRVVIATRPK